MFVVIIVEGLYISLYVVEIDVFVGIIVVGIIGIVVIIVVIMEVGISGIVEIIVVIIERPKKI